VRNEVSDLAPGIAEAFRDPEKPFQTNVKELVDVHANFGTITLIIKQQLRIDFIYFRNR
jgi:hypothetical protein